MQLRTESLLIVGCLLLACGGSTPCRTDGDCGSGRYCDPDLNACLQAGEGHWTLAWKGPGAGSTVGKTVALRAGFDARAGVLPGTLSYAVTLPDGGAAGAGTLQAVGDGGYEGSWTPLEEGPHMLVATATGLAGDVGTADTGPIQVTVDLTGPAMVAQVEPSTVPHGMDGGTQYDDPASGFIVAYRRDEVRNVRVTSQAADVDPQSLSVKVTGDDGQGGGETIALTGGTECSDAPFCLDVPFDFSKPQLKAFRGHFGLTVSARDRVGNLGTPDSKALPVTRWKWRYVPGLGTTRNNASVTVGHQGVVYIVTNDATGTLLAIKPDGSLKWSKALGQPVDTTPSVGTAPDGSDRIYLPLHGSSAMRLVAFDSTGTPLTTVCSFSAMNSAATSLAVAPPTSAGKGSEVSESAITVISDGSASLLFMFRPDDVGPDQCLWSNAAISPSIPRGALVANGMALYYGSSSAPTVEGFEFADYVWSLAPGFPTGGVNVGWDVASLAISQSNEIFGSSVGGGGGSFFDVTTGSLAWSYPDVPSGFGATHDVILDVDGNLISSASWASVGPKDKLVRVTASGKPDGETPSGFISVSPLLGAGGRLYSVDGMGTLSTWQAEDLSASWSIRLEPSTYVTAPNLDCSRDANGEKQFGRPGVLYYGTQTASVYAVVVDSPGLDVGAQWPMYLHDPRHTSNAQTGMAEFGCE
jgi:hypothetical protein